jgi:hypothetical protein
LAPIPIKAGVVQAMLNASNNTMRPLNILCHAHMPLVPACPITVTKQTDGKELRMADAEVRAFSPPTGFPYVFTQAANPDMPGVTTQRHRLANNVVCLFGHDKEPVANPRRRAGRYPQGVISLRMRNRILPGVYCYIRSGVNQGCVVRVIGKGQGRCEWEIMAVGTTLTTYAADHPYQCCHSTVADIQAHLLRRCAPPSL